MERLNEELLDAWIRLTSMISNRRLTSDMPYGEALVCNLLYRNSKRLVTATDLCQETGILKSQMNRTLSNMEEKGLIVRTRSEQDKRQLFIALNMEQMGIYMKQHREILDFIDGIIVKFGEDRTREAIEMLNEIMKIAQEVMG